MAVSHANISHSVVWAALEAAITLITSLGVTILVAKFISPSQFGVAAIALFIGYIAERIVAFTFSESIIQRKHISINIYKSANTATIFLSLITSSVICLLAPVIADIYKLPEAVSLLQVQALTCLLYGIRSTPEALLSRKMRFRALSIRSIYAKVGSSVVAILLALNGFGAWSLILGNLAFGIISTVLVVSQIRFYPRYRLDSRSISELLSYGIYSLLDSLIWTATLRAFGFIVGYHQGINAIGYLGIAFRINDSTSGLLHSLSARIALPVLARYAADISALQKAFEYGTRLIAIISIPVFIGIALLSSDIVQLLLGVEWAPAAPALAVTTLYSAFNFSRLLAEPTIKSAGHPRILVWQQLFALCYVVVVTSFTASISFNTALLTWLAFGPIYFVISVVSLKFSTSITIRNQIMPLVGSIISTALMSIAVVSVGYIIDPAYFLTKVLVKIFLGSIIYIFCISLLEKAAIKSVLQQLSGEKLLA